MTQRTQPSSSDTKNAPFVSVRWRLMLPLIVLSAVMILILAAAAISAQTNANAAALTQLTGLILASLAVGAVITTFIVLNWLIGRIRKVTRVAEALALGDMTARTAMERTDEVSRMGYALDQYADRVQNRSSDLRNTSRRGRREIGQFTAGFEAMNEGVILLDLDGQVRYLNAVAKNLLDLPGGLRGAIEEEREAELTEYITDQIGGAIMPGGGTGEARRVELHADQPERARTVWVSAAPMMSLQHHRAGTLVLLHTAQGDSVREQARPLLDRLVALADHEETSGTLRGVVRDLRDLFAAPDSATATADKPINLDKLVFALVNEWRQTAQAANLTLELQNEHTGLSVLGDERRLRYAIGSLLDNAVKYTPPGGKVTLEIKGEDKGRARLRIRDNGTGISPDDLPHIFTRFFRGTPTTSGGRVIRVPGSGQGLTLAREIIEAHGGTITIKSQNGVGTAIYFTLPTTVLGVVNTLSTPRLQTPYLDDTAVGEDTVLLDEK